MVHGLLRIGAQLLLNRNVQIFTINSARASSQFWGGVPMGPPDVILGISEAYKKCTEPKKVNLGVGAYRDDSGKPWVLPSIRKAEEIVHKKHLNHEYAPISGEASFTEACARLVFGECSAICDDKSLCSVQSLSGTGALRLGFEFIKKFYPVKEVYFPNLTWGNHPQICNSLGLENKRYRYYDAKTISFDIKGALEDICNMPERSVIVLHACAHNPTGVDPKPEEWQQLSEAVKERKLLPYFDSAYQGFATGDVDRDAFAIRKFVEDGHQVMLAQSFAKNMGLYGERAGCLHIACGDEETQKKVMSQLKILIRVFYSNPPLFGSRLVTEVLTNNELKQEWLRDVKTMADRINSMRKRLREGIEKRGNKNKWNHITDQIGMFCFTGLTPPQVERLTKEYFIFLTKDGRISMAGVTSANVDYVAEAIHKVSS